MGRCLLFLLNRINNTFTHWKRNYYLRVLKHFYFIFGNENWRKIILCVADVLVHCQSRLFLEVCCQYTIICDLKSLIHGFHSRSSGFFVYSKTTLLPFLAATGSLSPWRKGFPFELWKILLLIIKPEYEEKKLQTSSCIIMLRWILGWVFKCVLMISLRGTSNHK